MDSLEKHMKNVAKICRVLGFTYGLGKIERQELELAASRHDIGKRQIGYNLFVANRRLTQEEYVLIKSHAAVGASLLLREGFDTRVVEAVRHHHEWWNGGGYPDGLKDLEIPLFSRMISVADAYDAMTAGRPYRKAESPTKAREELLRNAGKQFDPEIVLLLAFTCKEHGLFDTESELNNFPRGL